MVTTRALDCQSNYITNEDQDMAVSTLVQDDMVIHAQVCSMWDTSSQEVVPARAIVTQASADVVKPAKTPALVQSEVLSAPILPTLPSMNATQGTLVTG